MTSPNELRIDNYVYIDGYPNSLCTVEKLEKGLVTVKAVMVDKSYADGTYYCLSIEPIPLSEAWFKKFGFFEFTDSWGKRVNMNNIEVKREGDKYFFIFNISGCIRLESVHQLQNLVYALTGTELTLKP